ncbi:hypothetical protein JTE90_016727 [Oedothorax gibbosus]|uniref:Uncharacterized protein n=1 Tax=Oedothorax gibbosus TaxID=931172 RepID=A0AAV6TH72_9ARAC|nr:hypothetical protein JTE90_016727 [Oedothorax gibbosus]
MKGADWKKVLPLGYPVTHDGYVIVPEFQNNSWIIDALQPAIVQSNIIGLLKRQDSTPDYCTNISSSRLSRSTKKGKYQVIPLPSQSKAASLPALPVFKQSLFQSKTLRYTIVVLALAFLMTIIMIWVGFLHCPNDSSFMNEYEFRLVGLHPQPLDHVLKRIGPVERQVVTYFKPHFRMKSRCLETKAIKSTCAVYFEGLWFRWVHSVETPFQKWSTSTHNKFVNQFHNFSCPFWSETRQFVKLDQRAQVYTFRDRNGMYRLVFEWEYGTFEKPLSQIPNKLSRLKRYRDIFQHFKSLRVPTYTLNETLLARKSVTYTSTTFNNDWLIARKVDGIFGFVFSYKDHLRVKWEDETEHVRHGMSLGDGIVFAAEKVDDMIVLLDVYQVRGHPTVSWCRRAILTEFLPGLTLPDGFRVQQYRKSKEELPHLQLKTDGYIMHNTATDEIVKLKKRHSIDVLYMDGYFTLPSVNGSKLGTRALKHDSAKMILRPNKQPC